MDAARPGRCCPTREPDRWFTVTTEAERRGWAVEVIADEGVSGKYVNTGLRDCLDQLATGRADALIVAKLDRLARSVRNAIDIIDAAHDQGWDLVVCDLALDLSNPQGRAMANMLATCRGIRARHDLGPHPRRAGGCSGRGKRIGRPRLASASVVDRIVRDRVGGACSTRSPVTSPPTVS